MKMRYAMAVVAAAGGLFLTAGHGAASLAGGKVLPVDEGEGGQPLATAGLVNHPYTYGAQCAIHGYQTMCVPSGALSLTALFQHSP